MRPRPRLRKTAKWAWAVVCLTVAVGWLLQQWWSVGWTDVHTWSVEAYGGTLHASYIDPAALHPALNYQQFPQAGWSLSRTSGLHGSWLPAVAVRRHWRTRGFSRASVRVPLWIPFLL